MPKDNPAPAPVAPMNAADPVVPPYFWVPPRKFPLAEPTTLANLQVSRSKYPPENYNKIQCPVLDNTAFEDFPGQEHLDPADPQPRLKKNPHPLSDYSHVDPVAAPTRDSRKPDFAKLKEKFQDDDARLKELTYLERLNTDVGPNAAGFQRLKRAFNLLICRLHTHLGNLNKAIVANDPDAYTAARLEYLKLIANMDDREPHLKKDGVDRDKRYGYGRNAQWAFVDPVLKEFEVQGRGKLVLIEGMRVFMKWNPHSSSSGVPIPH